MKKQPTVKEIMQKVFLKFEPETPLKNAVNILGRKRLFGACVVDQDDRVLGVLSEKECLKLYTQAFKENNPEHIENKTVFDILRPEFKTVSGEMNLFDVAQIFLQNEFRRMPVVDEGKLIGQITRRDIVRAIQDYVRVETIKD